ncbi:hypothetical protein [Agrobacterium vitis]
MRSADAPDYRATVFDGHWHGFRVFGGVPGRGIYDTIKTTVDRVGRA